MEEGSSIPHVSFGKFFVEQDLATGKISIWERTGKSVKKTAAQSASTPLGKIRGVFKKSSAPKEAPHAAAAVGKDLKLFQEAVRELTFWAEKENAGDTGSDILMAESLLNKAYMQIAGEAGKEEALLEEVASCSRMMQELTASLRARTGASALSPLFSFVDRIDEGMKRMQFPDFIDKFREQTEWAALTASSDSNLVAAKNALFKKLEMRFGESVGKALPVTVEKKSLEKLDKPKLPQGLPARYKEMIDKWHAVIPNAESCIKTFGRMSLDKVQLPGKILSDPEGVPESSMEWVRLAIIAEGLKESMRERWSADQLSDAQIETMVAHALSMATIDNNPINTLSQYDGLKAKLVEDPMSLTKMAPAPLERQPKNCFQFFLGQDNGAPVIGVTASWNYEEKDPDTGSSTAYNIESTLATTAASPHFQGDVIITKSE